MTTIQNLKIADLTPYPGNPRDNDGAVPGVVASIRQYGFIGAIIVNKDRVIINGHTRVKAMKELGAETIPAIVVDHLTPEQEAARIPEFLAAENYADALGYLDYELWPVTDIEVSETGINGGTVEVSVTQEHPRLFDTAEFVSGNAGSDDPARDYDPFIVTGTYSIENHYPYYMHDQGL